MVSENFIKHCGKLIFDLQALSTLFSVSSSCRLISVKLTFFMNNEVGLDFFFFFFEGIGDINYKQNIKVSTVSFSIFLTFPGNDMFFTDSYVKKVSFS